MSFSVATFALVAFVFLAFTIESALGFGATLVTVTLGVLVAPVDVILPAFMPVNVALSARLVFWHRPHVRWDLLLKRILPLMALGMPIGMLAFAKMDTALLVKVFGAFVVVLAVVELFLRKPAASSADTSFGGPFATMLLVLGGVVHGAFGTGGPMVVYVVGRTLVDKAEFRATLSALWLLLNLVLLVSHVVGGRWTADTPFLTLTFIPALVLGLFLGQRLHDQIPAARFRRVVFAGLALAGLVLLIR